VPWVYLPFTPRRPKLRPQTTTKGQSLTSVQGTHHVWRRHKPFLRPEPVTKPSHPLLPSCPHLICKHWHNLSPVKPTYPQPGTLRVGQSSAQHAVRRDLRWPPQQADGPARVPQDRFALPQIPSREGVSEVMWKCSSNLHVRKKTVCSERKRKLPVDTTYAAPSVYGTTHGFATSTYFFQKKRNFIILLLQQLNLTTRSHKPNKRKWTKELF